ncbi:HNH endonuclease signature motif containing protein [Cronbergia sp. UHCC 0137]|uniref:HNH endonuclease n=1 Tax=Cronbergia sp. UHCC 0137 TaxID=3110239 RepID=UPI002B1F7C6A|nr:HNH endonuclease signature motif containing protein [Cronbergia sp. UHCC 0137]MEA5620541.1 HNH endonuclease signature motif containing protein [Cronbergia sp. UHCC 0137]
MSYVSATLRRLVTQRAGNKCEYCQFPQMASLFAFEMEHIIAEKHDGITEAGNLALSCPCCNRFKGTDLGSIDPETRQLTAFFNPRLQQWSDHFRLEEGIIMPLTPEGRVTAKILQFNLLERILERKQLGSIK